MPLKADRPWEGQLDGLSFTILQEDGRLRCWYGVVLPETNQSLDFQQGRAVESGGAAFCYAESKDGFIWTKPNLGILSYNGSTNNNIVRYASIYASVLHDRHGTAEEQFKSFEFGKLPPEELARSQGGSYNSYCLYAAVSPDGYHWSTLTNTPLVRHFCDTQNICAWDSALKKYVGYFRDHQGGRAISRAETEDFHAWPPPQPILESGPEEAPDGEYYNNCFTTYPGDPSIRLMFPSVYHTATDKVDVRMAMSREGRMFSWVSRNRRLNWARPASGTAARFMPRQIWSGSGMAGWGWGMPEARSHTMKIFWRVSIRTIQRGPGLAGRFGTTAGSPELRPIPRESFTRFPCDPKLKRSKSTSGPGPAAP
jgi:hypothetical protein